MTRLCKKCEETKSTTEFSVDRRRKDGLQYYCKNCRNKAKKAWSEKHKDKVKKSNKAFYENNKEKRLKYNQEYYKEYYAANKKEYISRRAKRRAAKLQRTPVWADLGKIKKMYLECPSGFHVDHIVPLQGDIVSGLHVENNLQYLTAAENLSKGNKYD